MRIFTALAPLLLLGCADTQPSPGVQPPAPVQRFLPAGADPEIALDTQTGLLCRTVQFHAERKDVDQAFKNALPKGLKLVTDCMVSQSQKDLGFIPDACTSGKTWVLPKPPKTSTPLPKYADLPMCSPTSVTKE